MLSVSMVPFAYGAAAGWNLGATPDPADIKDKNIKYKMDDLLHAICLAFIWRWGAASLRGLHTIWGLPMSGWGGSDLMRRWIIFCFREKWDFANCAVNRAPGCGAAKTVRRRKGCCGGPKRRDQASEGQICRPEFVYVP